MLANWSLAVTMSGLPSPSKSPTARLRGVCPPASAFVYVGNVPVPVPSRMLTPSFDGNTQATARSGFVSWLKSPTTTVLPQNPVW